MGLLPRDVLLLAIGACAGIGLAVAGLVRPAEPALPGDAVARVDDVLISREEFEGRLRQAAQAGVAPDPAALLDLLVEEELLLQRGLELGLVRRDSTVRAALLQVVRASARSTTADEPPDEAALRSFYRARQDRFREPARLRVEQIYFARGTPPSRAEAAAEALARGEPFDEVRETLGEPWDRRLPPVPLSEAALARVLGQPLAALAFTLPQGATTEPVRAPDGIHILRVVERRDAQVPPFEAVAVRVENEWLLERAREQYRAYVDALRAQADVRTGDPAPARFRSGTGTP